MALTQTQLDKAVRAVVPGVETEIKVGDPDRLRLRVSCGGAQTWVVRYRTPGGQRRMRIGSYVPKAPKVDGKGPAPGTLAWARVEAAKVLGRVANGEDPSVARQTDRERTGLVSEIGTYLESIEPEKRTRTMRTYRDACERIVQWASKARVKHTEELTPAKLANLRTWLVNLPKVTAKQGGKRGERRATEERRSPVTVNVELRAIKTCLNTLRRQGKLPKLHRDDITDNLQALRVDLDEPDFLHPKQAAKLLAAAVMHDAETFTETRDEHVGNGPKGQTPKYPAIAPFAAVLLLTGMRRGEALALRWEYVDLDAADHEGRRVGEIRLPAAVVKTKRGRTIGLEVSPGLYKLLAAMKLRAGEEPLVFPGYSVSVVEKARMRLVETYEAPSFSWQTLRSTCATFLNNAPGIYGSAAHHMSAKQLGHSVVVAERRYAGRLRSVSRTARTLDEAMGIGEALGKVLDAPAEARPVRRRTAVAK